MNDTWNPLNWDGPFFLLAYLCVVFGTWALASILNARARRATPSAGDDLARATTPYEAAYLLGGSERVVATAAAALVGKGLLRVFAGGTLREVEQRGPYRGGDTPDPQLSAWERKILYRVRQQKQCTVGELDKHFARELAEFESRSRRMGWRWGRNYSWIGTGLLSLLALTGAAKVYVGFSRDRPVEYLAVLVVITVVFAFNAYVRRGPLTDLGVGLLEDLRARHDALRMTVFSSPSMLHADDVAWSFALFGGTAFASAPLLASISLLGSFPEVIPSSLFVERRQASDKSDDGFFFGTGCGGGCGGCGGCGG